MTFDNREKLAEIRRELAMRRRVYPGMVVRQQITQEQADKQIAILQAVAIDYERLIAPDMFAEAVK